MATSSHFSQCLVLLIERRGVKQSQVARGSGFATGHFSAILAGKPTSAEGAGAIARVFAGPEDQTELMRAWLLDKVKEAGYAPPDLPKFAGGDMNSAAIPVGLLSPVQVILEVAANSKPTSEMLAAWGDVLREHPARKLSGTKDTLSEVPDTKVSKLKSSSAAKKNHKTKYHKS